MADLGSHGLCGFLRRIEGLLEKGDAVAAAAVVAEMNQALASLPLEMPDAELTEAQGLLVRCEEMEQGMRKEVLSSLQRLAATRKSSIYRGFGDAP